METVSMHQRVEDNAFHVHFCELPGEIERAKLWPAAAPVLECGACIDLEFVVAGLTPDVILPVVAVASAAPLPVYEADFSRDIHVI